MIDLVLGAFLGGVVGILVAILAMIVVSARER